MAGVPLLSVKAHGIVIVLGLTSPQARLPTSPGGVRVAQLALVEDACRWRLASAQKAAGLLVAVQAGSQV